MSWLEQEALLSIKNLLIACLHQELQPFKSEIFHFFGHKTCYGTHLRFLQRVRGHALLRASLCRGTLCKGKLQIPYTDYSLNCYLSHKNVTLQNHSKAHVAPLLMKPVALRRFCGKMTEFSFVVYSICNSSLKLWKNLLCIVSKITLDNISSRTDPMYKNLLFKVYLLKCSCSHSYKVKEKGNVTT